ncbi:unnamed protein product [Onchocerca ochengi]|uniref:MAM domain-containing protein n=1 Tax=Onchocerca ochengi TaxID=42157 RepID=A0A182E2F3_ONCOC|nr:unnamed protein product [Onchocerca ochengi]
MTTERITVDAESVDITRTLPTELTPETQSIEPFDLLIIGSKTTPFFDHRRGRIIANNTMLFCDFTNDFLCLWGPESGKWGIIQEGAIPSLTVPANYPTPIYPVAIVIQGTAMLTSDPLKCQTDSGKLKFRHWTNGSPTIQACIIGYGIGSKKVECMRASQNPETADDKSLLVFDFKQPVLEPFTLNIVPQWDNTARNQYLIIDEIAYLGSCDIEKLNKKVSEGSLTEQTGNIIWTKPKSYENLVWIMEKQKTESSRKKQDDKASKNTSVPITNYSEWITLLPATTSNQLSPDSTHSNYCKLLNCNFEENACNYLNHGLTKVPWMLRNHGTTISKSVDIPPFPSKNQFISTKLPPNQYAILESPRFNVTSETITVLFQYYRSSFSAIIRLCLDNCSVHMNEKASTFVQCPLLNLETQLSKKMRGWYTARIQLPPGTIRYIAALQFYLVAHNSNKSIIDTMVAIDNIKLSSCGPEKDAMIDMNNTSYQKSPGSFVYFNKTNP